MDILGVFYVPRDGVEKSLPTVAANAALGWYDALRFGSESGRAEIVSNESFFKKAYTLSERVRILKDNDYQYAKKASRFFQDNPDLTAKLVDQGLKAAESLRDDPRYDHHWPTAYGLEHLNCAMGQVCSIVPELPKEQWDKAWIETKKRVSNYYRDEPPRGSVPAALNIERPL